MPQRSLRRHLGTFLIAILIVNAGAISMAINSHVHMMEAEGAKAVVQRLLSMTALMEHLHAKSFSFISSPELGSHGQIEVFVGQLASIRPEEGDSDAVRLLDHLAAASSSPTIVTVGNLATTVVSDPEVSLEQDPGALTTEASIFSNILNRRVNIKEHSRRLSYSCPFIAAGAGLSLISVSLVVMMIGFQCANLLAVRSKWLGVVVGYVLYTIVPLAFLLGTLAAVSHTQNECHGFERGESIKSTLDFYTEVVSALHYLDDTGTVTGGLLSDRAIQVHRMEDIAFFLESINSLLNHDTRSEMLLYRSAAVGVSTINAGIDLLIPSESSYEIPIQVSSLLSRSSSGGTTYAISSYTDQVRAVVATTFNTAVGLSIALYQLDTRSSNLLNYPHLHNPTIFGVLLILGVALVACLSLPVADLGVRVTSFVHVPPSINVSRWWALSSPARITIMVLCTCIAILSFLRISSSINAYGWELWGATNALVYAKEVVLGILLQDVDRVGPASVGETPLGLPDMTSYIEAATSPTFVATKMRWYESLRAERAQILDPFSAMVGYATSYGEGTIVPILQSITTPLILSASTNSTHIYMYLLEHEAATISQLLTQNINMSTCIEANIGGGRSFLTSLSGTSDALREIQVAMASFDETLASKRSLLPATITRLSSLKHLQTSTDALASANAILRYLIPYVPAANRAILQVRTKDYSKQSSYSSYQIDVSVAWGVTVIVFVAAGCVWDTFYTAIFLAPSYPKRTRDISRASGLIAVAALCCVAAITLGAYGSSRDVIEASTNIVSVRDRNSRVGFVLDAVSHAAGCMQFYSEMSVFPSSVDSGRCIAHRQATFEALRRIEGVSCTDCKTFVQQLNDIATDIDTIWNAYAALINTAVRTDRIPLDDIRDMAQEAHDLANSTFAWFAEMSDEGELIRDAYCPEGSGGTVLENFPPACGGLTTRVQLVDNYTSMLRSVLSLSRTGVSAPLTGSLDYLALEPILESEANTTDYCPMSVVTKLKRINNLMRQMYDVVSIAQRHMGAATLSDMTVLNTRSQSLIRKFTNTAEDLIVLLRNDSFEHSEYFYTAFWLPVIFVWLAAIVAGVSIYLQQGGFMASLGYVTASR